MHLSAISFSLSGLFAMMLAVAPAAGQSRSQHVEAELLSDVTTVQPGQPFSLGVRLKMTPRWHVYWSNPGETGLPTQVTFSLPDGFEVGELRYPLPKEFVQPGEIVGYGYENEVLLIAQVTPPVDHQGDVPVTAKAEWLVCDRVCIPGRVELSLTLKSGARAEPANEELFAHWRARLPLDQQAGEVDVPEVKHSAATSGAGVTTNRLRLALAEAPQKIEWFPPGHQALLISKPEVRQDDTATEMTFSVSAMKGMKEWPTQLDGLVVYTTAAGERRGVTVPVVAPVPSSDAQAGR